MKRNIRPVTQNLVQALLLDSWPSGNAVYVDFGLDGWGGGSTPQQRYECLKYALKSEGVTLEQLDKALGDGPALTRLIQSAPGIPPSNLYLPNCLG